MSDLARILAIKGLLREGWECVIWVDADVLVFDPDGFVFPASDQMSLVRELWLERDRTETLTLHKKVNNSVMVCPGGTNALDALEVVTLRTIAELDRPGKLDAGTTMLTNRQAVQPVELLDCVGCFGPVIIRDLIRGRGGSALKMLQSAMSQPFGAANLCRSLSVDDGGGGEVSEAHLEAAVEVLLEEGPALMRPSGPTESPHV
jgi:hypothetical protein